MKADIQWPESNLLRPFDRFAARRALRAQLVEIAAAKGRTAKGVPHSFQLDELLDAGREALRSRRPEVAESRQQLLAGLGVTLARNGHDDESIRLFEQGFESAPTDRQRGYFRYLLGHEVFQRRGEWRRALDTLSAVIDLVPAAAATRARAHIALIPVARHLGESARARQEAEAAIATGIHEFEPHARMRLAVVLWRDGLVAEAATQLDTAKRLFGRLGNGTGQCAVDANTGVMFLDAEDAERAYPLLVRTRRHHYEVLDLTHLARSYHNEAIALMHLGRTKEAEQAYLNALRFHGETGRWALYASTLQSLALCLEERGETGLALAAFHRAAVKAAEIQATKEEFAALAHALAIMQQRGVHLHAASHLLSRCHHILEETVPAVSREQLAGFARTTAGLLGRGARIDAEKAETRPRGFPSREARDALQALMDAHTGPPLDEHLNDRLGTGLLVRRAPSTDQLKSFLFSWQGCWFGNADYRQEFTFAGDSSKYQLRRLRDRRVIRQVGQRKATRYHLCFHLPAETEAAR